MAITVRATSPSIRDRIIKLEEAGVIKRYSLVLDNRKLGLAMTAFIGVMLDHPQCCREDVVKALDEIPEVAEGHYTDGEEDMLIKVVTRDTESLMDILAHITSIEGITKTRTIISLSNIIAR